MTNIWTSLIYDTFVFFSSFVVVCSDVLLDAVHSWSGIGVCINERCHHGVLWQQPKMEQSTCHWSGLRNWFFAWHLLHYAGNQTIDTRISFCKYFKIYWKFNNDKCLCFSCFAKFLLFSEYSVCLFLQEGLYILELIDFFGGGTLVFILAILEASVISWIYGNKNTNLIF